MADMVDGEVLIHEADIPNEDFGDQFDSREFMNLEQARGNLHPTVFEQVRSSVWPNVVQVIVPVTQQKNAYGTGFIFKGPYNQKLIMTNYHVIRPFNQSLKRPIQVKLDYDSPRAGWIIPVDGIEYYSRSGEKVDADHCDFCALRLQSDLEREGILLESTTGRLNAMFSKTVWDATESIFRDGERFGEGLIVGHPRGSYKRVSVVKLAPCEDEGNVNFTREYEEVGTRPGSSGSPVVCNCVNRVTSTKWVYVLHFASGRGVTIVKVIDAINRQM